jgi:alcohol dehydrogenase class IV
MVHAKWDYEIPAHLKREFIFQTAGILPPHGILFGFNTIYKVGEQAAKLGCQKVLLVTDETMVQLGYADLVQHLLEKEGMKVDLFAKVEPEPHMETANKLGDMVRKVKSDLVVGLGGGSPMDMAKLTAILATNKKSPLELMRKKLVSKPALKKILIPTTSGSGSEVSGAFVASAGRDKYYLRSPYAFPEIAIIDPGFTVSLPAKATASSGIDALAHGVESLMNKLANPFFDSLGLGGVELVVLYLRRATFDGRDLEARYYMSMGATLSMISLMGTGGLYAHSISYVLAQFQPLPHGIGCGVSLPYTMAFNLPVIEDKLALIARAMGERIESVSREKAAQIAVERVYDLIVDVKMPVSLKELGFRRKDLPKMAGICVDQYPRMNNPRPMSTKDCLDLFESMWEGKIRLPGMPQPRK